MMFSPLCNLSGPVLLVAFLFSLCTAVTYTITNGFKGSNCILFTERISEKGLIVFLTPGVDGDGLYLPSLII